EPDGGGAVLPPRPPPGARPGGPTACGDDAEGPAAAEAGVVDAGRPGRGIVPAGAGRPECPQGAGTTARPLLREDLLRPRGARAPARAIRPRTCASRIGSSAKRWPDVRRALR